ncbi:NAD-binding protein [Halomonas sp. 1390]|uniref:NAD-binding protein n=1 Tax=Halomonas sp. B23F22_3 TaxID=3459516 RepID=UPI00373E2397
MSIPTTLCGITPSAGLWAIALALIIAAWLLRSFILATGFVITALLMARFVGLEQLAEIGLSACATWITFLILAFLLGFLVLVLQLRRRWLARVPAVAALLVLFLGGALAAYVHEDEPTLTNVYRTLQLFAGQADWTQKQVLAHMDRRDDALLVNFTHLVRLLGILATFALIVSLFRNLHGALLQLSSRLLAPNKRIVLCGLGELGMQFVQAYYQHMAGQSKLNFLRWLRSHYRLIIIEQDPGNPHIESCLDKGYPVLVRDVFDPEVQLRARVHRSDYVIHALPDDTRNVELAISIRSTCEETIQGSYPTWNSRLALLKPLMSRLRWRPLPGQVANRPAAQVPKLLIHVNDPLIARRAEDNSRLGPEQSTETRFFNLYETSARKVFAEYGPDWYADTADADCVHIALYGYNAMAEALLEQAVRLSHFDRDAPMLRISLFDPDFLTDDGRSVFAQRYPRLGDLARRAEIRLLPMAGQQCIDREALHECARNGIESLTPPTQHFVCFDDDALTTRFALELRDLLRDQPPVISQGHILAWNAPVFIRLKRHAGLARMFDVAERLPGDARSRMESPDNLHAFGMLDDVVQYTELLDERRDRLARTFHESGYRSVRQQRPALNAWRKASDVSWEHLNLFLKQSNRAQADHVRVKLRALRCVDAKPSPRPSEPRERTNALIAQAARETEIQSEPVLALQFWPELGALISVHGKQDYEQRAIPPDLVVRRLADNQLLVTILNGEPTSYDDEWDYRGEWVAKESCWYLTARGKGKTRLSVFRRQVPVAIVGNTEIREVSACGKLRVTASVTDDATCPQVVLLEQGQGRAVTVEPRPNNDELISALAVQPQGEQAWIIAVGWENGCVQTVQSTADGQRQRIVAGPWHRLLHGHPDREESAWERLARIEHDRWNATHWIGGWRYGKHRVDPAHVHDDLLPWEQITQGTRRFDRKGIAQLPFLLTAATANASGAAKETVCRRFLVGVTAGVRGREAASGDGQVDEQALAEVVNRLRAQAEEAARGMPIRFTVVSALTDGPERQVAKALVDRLGADLIVILPVPFELFYMDFYAGSVQAPRDAQAQARWRSVQEYAELVAGAVHYLELPMRFGNLEALGAKVDLTSDLEAYRQTPHYRQYQLGDAWLVQRCDALVCVERPVSQAGAATLNEVVRWSLGDSEIPDKLKWHERWFAPASLREPIMLTVSGSKDGRVD